MLMCARFNPASSSIALVSPCETEQPIYAKGADAVTAIASVTKLMTAYIIYGMLRAGRLKLDQELPVSERAWRMGGSKMFVALGTSVKVEDLLYGMIIQSGNDA